MTRVLLALLAAGLGAMPAAAAEPAAGAHGLRLPATFRGDLPCADCEAIRHHLDLWPDQVFHLRREWVGRSVVRDELGRWRVDAERGALVLEGGGERPLQFAIQGEGRLRALDIQGRPIESALPYALVSDGTLAPTDLALPLGGEMTYMADAARFTECRTGRGYPIAMEGEFVQAQAAYRESAPAPGAPLYVSFEGSISDRPKMEGEGAARTIVIRRFIRAWPGTTLVRCASEAPAMTTASDHSDLAGTSWNATSINNGKQAVASLVRDSTVTLEFRADRKAAGSAGCNRHTTTWVADGAKLSFGPAAATRMMCARPEVMEQEQSFLKALGAVATVRREDDRLELRTSAGALAVTLKRADRP